MAKQMLSFERSVRGESIAYVAIASLPFIDYAGKERSGRVAMRAIRDRDGKWRIDRADAIAGTWAPWEPISEAPYDSPEAAKAAIAEWAARQPEAES